MPPNIPPLSPRASGSRGQEEDEPILLSPRRMKEQLDAFGNMRKAGAGWGDALFSMILGKKMTPEQAALCIQTRWRAYIALVQYQESRGAGITIQAAARGMSTRMYQREQAAAAARLQARLRGNFTRDVTDYELVDFRCAAMLQAVWRGKVARAFANKLRNQKKAGLKRSFSWNRSKKVPRGKSSPAPPQSRVSQTSFRPRDAPAPSQAKPVKRSSSFDRFSFRSKPKETSFDAAPTGPPPSKQLLFILLSRGPNGLGLELDATNTIVNIVKGGAADVQGYFKLGDTIASVDGIPLRRRLLQEVMDPRKSSYSFDVWRISRQEPEPKNDKPVRRALSFDRKRR